MSITDRILNNPTATKIIEALTKATGMDRFSALAGTPKSSKEAYPSQLKVGDQVWVKIEIVGTEVFGTWPDDLGGHLIARPVQESPHGLWHASSIGLWTWSTDQQGHGPMRRAR